MDISVIIPIHEWNDKVEKLYNKALETISKQDGVEDRPQVIVS